MRIPRPRKPRVREADLVRWRGSYDEAIAKLRGWMNTRGWSPLAYQEEAWIAQREGRNGLIHLPTGAGKTYAGYFGSLARAIDSDRDGTKIIYLTPLKALSRDIEAALKAPIEALALGLRVESRTGDTSAYLRARQKKKKPDVLVTTPESLALLLSYDTAREEFAAVQTVIVDEWHELLGSKRGSLLELSLTRVRALAPDAKVWALSATLPNVREAALAASGSHGDPVLVAARIEREVRIEPILPDELDAFPWAGHLGLSMLGKVANAIDIDRSQIIFTNTRSQAERWYRGLLELKPEWAARMALHHGSLSLEERELAEQGIKSGALGLVVATSSLDLGVDLAPVEKVFQVGSPKGIARTIQRAGRSGHTPGAACSLAFVPTHALELVEIAACREAIARGEIEPRSPLPKPLDVIAQHLVTCALGGGFEGDPMLAEIRQAYSFQSVTEQEFGWVIDFLKHGGQTLTAYPGYHKLALVEGRYVVTSPTIARQHRLDIGTIVSDASIVVKFVKGGRLGLVEESYLAQLRPKDKFVFAGKLLELVKLRDMVAYVRLAKGKNAKTPRWGGGKLPFSPTLASAVRRKLEAVRESDENAEPEIACVRPLLAAQRRLSRLPKRNELLVELLDSREGKHLFLYPFEGRLVHEGLAAVLALRLARAQSATFALSANDYGIEIVCNELYPYEEILGPALFSPQGLVDDILASLNLTELAKRQFREVARIAGLVISNVPGGKKTSRQLQTSSSLLFDVFSRYEPNNLLLLQSRREVLDRHFETTRLRSALERIGANELRIERVKSPSPLAFPLMVERIGARLTTESLRERVEKLKKQWTRLT